MNFQQQQALAAAQAAQAQYGGGMTPQQQQQLAMAQQMAAQARPGGVGAAGMTPQQQQQLAMAQQMAAASGAMTPQQQQQLAMAQQMAAQYGAAGNMNPQQQLAMAQQMQAQYGGMAGMPTATPVAPGYAPPTPPMASGGGASSTVVSVQLPDGCMIGYDRLRNELIMNGKVSNTRMRTLPARPTSAAGGGSGMNNGAPAEPVEKRGMMTKLGWKKTMMGGDSWQPRFFVLSENSISYAKDASSPAINTIALNSGITVNVVNASTPARKNRYEDNDRASMGSMMTMNIGAMQSETSGPIGKDNCVEMIVPGQLGTMLDGVMNQNVMGLAMGGGLKEMGKTAQGRTYYMSCSSRAEAEEWANAIRNNVAALPQEAPTGKIGGANGYAGLNGMVNNAMAMKNTMNEAQDPSKSIDWFKRTLGTSLSNEQLFGYISQFYNELDRAGVHHA